MKLRVYAATLAAYLTADFVAPLSGAVGRSLSTSIDPGTVIVPFCAAFAVAFPVWGRIADRRRAGQALAVSLVALAAFGLLLALAPSIGVVLLARIGQGAAAAGVPPTVQALLARGAGDGSAGRAVSGMMVMVIVATLGGPALANVIADVADWRVASALLGVLPALAAAVVCAPLGGLPASTRARLRPSVALVAGWACATLVLAAYWTLITRWDDITRAVGAGDGGLVSALLPLAGLAGIPLALVGGRAADARGPRSPMVVVTGAGAVALLVAAVTSSTAMFVGGLCAMVALYWSYLPVVSAQVQRSAPAEARATAAGILYSSMWLGAALGGLAAIAAPDPRVIVAGAAASWALAALVAWRGFLPHPEPSEA